MVRALLFACFAVALVTIEGCNKTDYYYATNGFTLHNYDNSGSYIYESSSPIPKDAYVMRINYNSTLTDIVAVDANNIYEATNTLTSISIITLQNFDSLHPANSSVADCFINGPGTTSVHHVVTDFTNTKDYYPNHEPDDLWLMKLPANAGTYSFVVELSFSDGFVTRDTTTVTLN